MGGVVLLVAVGFVVFFYNNAQVKAVAGYPITGNFFKIGGLQPGSDVRVSGINVGTVKAISLDPESFDAVVRMSIDPKIKLPADTVAAIASDGLLGGKYVRLKPGREKKFLAAGAVITKTEDFRSLEDQVGEIIFLATGGSGGGN